MCNDFVKNIIDVYKPVKQYLKKWTESSSDFRIFKWLNLRENIRIDYNDVEKTVDYLKFERIIINNSKLFDQIINLNYFYKQQKPQFFELSCNEKITAFLLPIRVQS